jgi:methylphosphotriester-DNA--protein-cysteine methyltransferase
LGNLGRNLGTRKYVPAKPLSGFVAFFWHGEGHDVPYSKERFLPTGTVDLIIRLGSARASDSGISGPRSKSIIIERRSQDRLLGVHFRTGGASPFLGFPLWDLHNLGINLDDLWGEQQANRLLYLLHEAATVDMKFRVMERWLVQMADRPLEHHPAVASALSELCSGAGSSAAELADNAGFSQRRFIELFRNEVGITPKRFSRLRRFRKIIGALQGQQRVDWVDLALSGGYFDQSHLIHEFREFSGLAPGQYLGLRTPYINHVRMPV